jgi:hypothetical protein
MTSRQHPDDNPVLRQALKCVQAGWPVFPCHPGRKEPATPNGYLDATTDPDQVRAWFSRRPDLNLAVATGAPGPDVLDVDCRGPRAGGFPALERLRRAGLIQGTFAMIKTPNQGIHLYFTGSEQPSAHLPDHRVDFLAQGGSVLLPCSQLGGRPYEGRNVTGGYGTLDWDACLQALGPARTPQRPSPGASPALRDRLSAFTRRAAERQAHTQPPEHEADEQPELKAGEQPEHEGGEPPDREAGA